MIIILLIRSLFWSRYQGVSWWLIIIWFKYVLYPIIILMTSIWLWYCITTQHINSYLKRFSRMMICVLCVWVIWFGIKLSFPELMMNIWYGPVWDFVVWQNPPLYYRTGAGGLPRYSGLMAWPNNLAYLLVWLWPLVLLLRQSSKYRMIQTVGRLMSVVLTISRSAWIATVMQYIISYRHLITTLSLRSRYLWWWMIIVGLVMLVSFKYQSTLGHMDSIIEGISIRYQQPLWYGLWYSGPSALHHGSIVPENIYLQRLIDIGIVGFVCMISIIVLLIIRFKSLPKHLLTSYLHARWLGIIGLAIQWMFLHVLEDSTVNYLVLTIGWLLLGYLSYQHSLSKS